MLVLGMAMADVSNENGVKGKREAPMAEPSTEYLPPRIEAPYATYSPVQLQSLGEGAQQPPSFYFSNSYNSPTNAAANFGPNINHYALPPLEHSGNDIGNGLSQSVSSFNDAYNYGGLNNAANIYGNAATHLSRFNRLNEPDLYGNSNTNGYSDFKSDSKNNSPYYGNVPYSSPNGFNIGFSNGPISSALTSSNPPSYAVGVKGLGHYTQPVPVSNLHTNPLKNSRPVALTAANALRKPPSFIGEANSQSSFRPSFFLGSSYVSSTSDYSQPSLTSLGTTNQYIPPSNQFIATQTRNYLSPVMSAFTNNNQLPINYATKPPGTSYGIPDAFVYARNEPKATVYRLPFAHP